MKSYISCPCSFRNWPVCLVVWLVNSQSSSCQLGCVFLSLGGICILAFQSLPFILILSFILNGFTAMHFLNWITSQFLPWNSWKFLQTAWYRRLKNPTCPISHLQLLSILPSLWDRNISGRSCRGDAMANPQKFHSTIFSESVAQLWPHLKFWKQSSDIRWFLKFKDGTTGHCLLAISYSKGAINAHGRVWSLCKRTVWNQRAKSKHLAS